MSHRTFRTGRSSTTVERMSSSGSGSSEDTVDVRHVDLLSRG